MKHLNGTKGQRLNHPRRPREARRQLRLEQEWRPGPRLKPASVDGMGAPTKPKTRWLVPGRVQGYLLPLLRPLQTGPSGHRSDSRNLHCLLLASFLPVHDQATRDLKVILTERRIILPLGIVVSFLLVPIMRLFGADGTVGRIIRQITLVCGLRYIIQPPTHGLDARNSPGGIGVIPVAPSTLHR